MTYFIQDTLILSLNNLVRVMADFIPRFLLASMVLFLGIILSTWVKTAVRRMLKTIQISKMVANSPVERFFGQGFGVKADEVLATTAKWVVIYCFLILVLPILQLEVVAHFLTSLLNYIPKIISALMILILGVLGAGLIETMVKGALSQIDLATARLMGKLASYTVLVFTTLAAVSDLGIAQFFIKAVFIGFVATLSLGLGLAFGLGAKETIAAIFKKWYQREFATKDKGKAE